MRARLRGLPNAVFQVDANEGHLQVALDETLSVEALRELFASVTALLEELPERTETKALAPATPDGSNRILLAVVVVVAIVAVLWLSSR